MNMQALNHRLLHLPYRWTRALLACGIAVSAHADIDVNSLSPSGPAFRGGVVTAANPYGAEAGAKILEQGGNAIDAAVAIAYALNVVEPQSAGVGGGGFMLIHLAKTGETFRIAHAATD